MFSLLFSKSTLHFLVGKIAEKAVCRSVYLTECRINKNALLQTVFFFGDFAHWHSRFLFCGFILCIPLYADSDGDLITEEVNYGTKHKHVLHYYGSGKEGKNVIIYL